MVERVIFKGTKAIGVQVKKEGRTEIVYGEEIVLCAGGIKSPHLLMLSGVGDEEQLRKHGIDVVYANANVGKGIMDHPVITVRYRTSPLKEDISTGFMPVEVCLNYTAPEFGEEGDLQISCVASTPSSLLSSAKSPGSKSSHFFNFLRQPISSIRAMRGLSMGFILKQLEAGNDLTLSCVLHLERSRGSINLVSGDAGKNPEVDYRYLSSAEDSVRLRHSVRLAVDLLKHPSFKALGAKPIAPSTDDMRSDDSLDGWVRQNLGTFFHTSCGARMGPQNDSGAVVDQFGKVYGVSNLRVLDLSICPRIVRRGTSATAVMIGERAAEFFN